MPNEGSEVLRSILNYFRRVKFFHTNGRSSEQETPDASSQNFPVVYTLARKLGYTTVM